jgi:hypothetical protein
MHEQGLFEPIRRHPGRPAGIQKEEKLQLFQNVFPFVLFVAQERGYQFYLSSPGTMASTGH